MNISEAMVSSAISECQGFVIDAQLMKDGGVDVVNVDRIFYNRITEFVSLTIGCPTAETATGEKD